MRLEGVLGFCVRLRSRVSFRCGLVGVSILLYIGFLRPWVVGVGWCLVIVDGGDCVCHSMLVRDL